MTTTRIVIAGGGFGGLWTAGRLERLLGREPGVEIVVVCRDNYFLMTPLLFEACSGTLDVRHCSLPVREFLRRVRFVEATVHGIDLDRRVVRAVAAEGRTYEIPYDQLVLALGAITNQSLIPGSEHAFTFKTLADAMVLRNHFIERFERADVETDPERRRRLLTFVVIGAGLVGVELFGELTAFADEIVRYYRRVDRDEVRFVLCERGPRVLPEVEEELAGYAATVLAGRRGASLKTGVLVRSIEPGRVNLEGETIEADTIVLSAGIAPSPILADLPLDKDRRGHVIVDATLRCPARPEVWALGDCAHVPDPQGKPYPNLAQHALREGRVLAGNLAASLRGQDLEPFVYETLGIMASLGHADGLGKVLRVPLHGFPAWWVRRSYYLLQMPRLSRRLRIVVDWTMALLFRPDIVKVDLASERALLARDQAAGGIAQN
ncbi:MAG TPA: NAD(P)/FAD-dependent oxidoreductase [Thermoanaerobaculia bacterium]|nr:NAD(P)/FAD-dependent oxidoreductase [Thermoanaerobaculia bacterium]